MSTFALEYPPGATPLSEEEKKGLIPSHINTHGELNAAEQASIIPAKLWAISKNHKDIISDTFFKKLHKRMFRDVWKWAGTHRKSAKNIGVEWHNISTELHKLCEDTKFWIENKTYRWDELGARFHHRLICIHAFPNGNGRHARLITDLILKQNGQNEFSWGERTHKDEIGGKNSPVRQAYLTALRDADNKYFEKLIQFVRS